MFLELASSLSPGLKIGGYKERWKRRLAKLMGFREDLPPIQEEGEIRVLESRDPGPGPGERAERQLG